DTLSKTPSSSPVDFWSSEPPGAASAGRAGEGSKANCGRGPGARSTACRGPLAQEARDEGGEPGAQAAADEPALCLQCDMNDCYSRLRRLVPTIPPNKKVSKVEILQHVIDYILDLQLALETHPALLRQPPPPAPPLHPAGACPVAPPRTPLTALNTDPAGAVNKQGDSILCR
ncbi:inhibitor of DNA binding 4, partial [Mus musculus]